MNNRIPNNISKNELGWLEQQSKLWLQTGIINDQQRQQILGFYDTRAMEDVQRRRLTSVIGLLGALLLGVGVILFFASNWQEISKTGKLILIFGTLISCYGAGYYLAWVKQSYPKIGHALIFLGTIMFGAAINLIAQIYHISAHFPNGVLFWGLGILPVAWLWRSSPILWESIVLLTLWFTMESSASHHLPYVYWIIALVGVWPLIYKLGSRVALILILLSCYLWLGQYMALNDSFEFLVFVVVALAGFITYIYGAITQINIENGFKHVYQGIGLAVASFSLFVLTFDIYRFTNFSGFEPNFWLHNSSVLALVVIFGILAYRGSKTGNYVKEIPFITVLVICTALTALSSNIGNGNLNWDRESLYQLSYNLLLFALIIWMVYQGYSSHRPFMVNIGLAAFAVDFVARYFDWLWDLLDKSIFFMLGGLLLIVGGTFLERKRRQLIQTMGGVGHE